jgi:hypothetical protein
LEVALRKAGELIAQCVLWHAALFPGLHLPSGSRSSRLLPYFLLHSPRWWHKYTWKNGNVAQVSGIWPALRKRWCAFVAWPQVRIQGGHFPNVHIFNVSKLPYSVFVVF